MSGDLFGILLPIIVQCIIFGWIWLELANFFESETKPETNSEPPRNPVPAPNIDEKTDRTHIAHFVREHDEASTSSSTASPRDEDTEESKVDHFQEETKITEEYVEKLENDHRHCKRQIAKLRHQFRNLSVIIQGFEEMEQENERLKKEVKLLKKTVTEHEMNNNPFQPLTLKDGLEMQKNLRFMTDELNLLKEENSKLKLDLETSAHTLRFKLGDIEQLTATANGVNKKYQKISLKNDELILKLAASREIAAEWEEDCHEIESKLTKKINELKDQLNAKQKALEEKEAALHSALQAGKFVDQRAEEIQKVFDLQLANNEKSLAQTRLSEQLLAELTTLIKAVDKLQAENGRSSEEHDSTVLSLQETKKLSEDRLAIIDLLRATTSELKTKLYASESQLDEFKKEKSIQLNDALTGKDRDQLQREIADLKATAQTHLSSLEETMAKYDEVTTHNLELEKEISLLKSINGELKKEVKESRENLEKTRKEKQQLSNTERLAVEQLAALSGALAALEEGVTQVKDAAGAIKTEQDPMNSEATKTETEHSVPTKYWVGDLLAKRGVKIGKPQNQSESVNLLERTGLAMLERAQNLQHQANNIKAKGKELKKKAKTLSK